MAGEFDSGFALFVGGFVAVLFFLGAGILYLLSPGEPVVTGLATVLTGLGLIFLLFGGLLADTLRLLAD